MISLSLSLSPPPHSPPPTHTHHIHTSATSDNAQGSNNVLEKQLATPFLCCTYFFFESFLFIITPSSSLIMPHSPVGSNTDLRTGRLLVRSPARLIFFSGTDDSNCDRIHSSLTAVRCFDNGYVGKQPVVWKEYCAEHWLKEFQESMDRSTGRRDIAEILLKTALNTIQ